jgi:hypothetical protein
MGLDVMLEILDDVFLPRGIFNKIEGNLDDLGRVSLLWLPEMFCFLQNKQDARNEGVNRFDE